MSTPVFDALAERFTDHLVESLAVRFMWVEVEQILKEAS